MDDEKGDKKTFYVGNVDEASLKYNKFKIGQTYTLDIRERISDFTGIIQVTAEADKDYKKSIMAKGSDKVSDIIARGLKGGADAKDYGLKFDGVELKNKNKSLRYYGVKNGSIVTLINDVKSYSDDPYE